MRWVAGAAAAVLIVMGTLAFYAWRSAHAEKEAVKSKAKADADLLREAGRTKDALDQLVKTQTKIEGLLEALAPFVTEKSGKPVLERAEDIVRSVTSSGSNDPRVVTGLVGLRRVCARLYLRLGNNEAALNQAEQARHLLEEQMKNGNSDPAFAKQMHDCILLVGDCILGEPSASAVQNKTEADYSRAIATYQEAIDLAEKQMNENPKDASGRTLYFAYLTRLGEAAQFFGGGKVKEAEDNYDNALRLVAEMRRKNPRAGDLNRIEASIHDRLGTLYLDKGRKVDAARKQFDLSLNLRQAGPNDELSDQPERQSDIATSYNKLGKVFEDQEKWKEALDYYDRALAIRRKLLEQDKGRESLRGLGQSLGNVARVQWQMTWKAKNSDTIRRAVDLTKERLQITETLRSEDDSDPHTQADYASALAGYADLLLNVSDPTVKDRPHALTLAQQAVQLTDRRDPRSLAVLAQALRLNNLPADARKAAEEAYALLPPPQRRNSDDRRNWYDINYELQKDRSAAVGTPAQKPPAR